MKNNLPVTDREFTVPPGEILVSQTDDRGIITYANSTFAEVSGFAVNELIGKSHNIVRHPAVPAAVFAQMWATLQRGEVWQGLLLNRRKDGGRYWVDTVVVPQREGATVTGYLSVRRQPAKADIEATEREFARLRTGTSRGWRQAFRLDRWLSIRSGVALSIVGAVILLAVGAGVGLHTMARADRAMEHLHTEAVEAGAMLARIKFLMADNRALVLDSAARYFGGGARQSHDVNALTRKVDDNRRAIEQTWRALNTATQSARLAQLREDYWVARQRYVHDGLNPVIKSLASGRPDEAYRLIGSHLDPLYDAANTHADALIAHMQDDAAATLVAERTYFQRVYAATFVALVLVSLGIIAAGVLFLRHVVRPIEDRIDDLRRMSEGHLGAHVDTAGGGEIGNLNRAFAATQAQLQFLLDILSRDATAVAAQSARLRLLAAHINDGIDEQHGRLWRIAERFIEARTLASSLAKRTESFMATCTRASKGIECVVGDATAAPAATALADDIEEGALVVATEGRLLDLLTDELARDIDRIADFFVDHREAAHGLWWSARQLTDAAAELETSTQRFDLG